MSSPEQPTLALRNLGPVLLLVALLVGAGAYSGAFMGSRALGATPPAPEALREQAPLRGATASAPTHEVLLSESPPAATAQPQVAHRGVALTDEVLDALDCTMPQVRIDETSGCARGRGYPACKWQVPPAERARNLYRIWRNTSERHLQGRPALVSLVLAAATEYVRLFPGEVLAIGDLDAPGPRHRTHRRGVDVDLYLPGMMEVENRGNGQYAGNYGTLNGLQRRMLRARVEQLAQVLATCAQGRLRIYYNDPVVIERFGRWFASRGYRSPFGAPMQEHNELHRFHFHVTIAADLEPLAANE